MSAVQTRYQHVEVDEKGVPLITGTTMKVVELVTEYTANGWSPEELHFQHPYLTLGQIYSALAYYWDHKDELDQDIERRYQLAEQMRREAGPSPFSQRIKEAQKR